MIFPQFISDNFGGRVDVHSWTSLGMFNHSYGRGNAAIIPGTVDVLLLADSRYDTLVLSPFSHYLAATQQSSPTASRDGFSKNILNCGIQGLVEEIPAGFEQKHILVAGLVKPKFP